LWEAHVHAPPRAQPSQQYVCPSRSVGLLPVAVGIPQRGQVSSPAFWFFIASPPMLSAILGQSPGRADYLRGGNVHREATNHALAVEVPVLHPPNTEQACGSEVTPSPDGILVGATGKQC